MLFLLAFALHVAASFAFLLAILSPAWLTIRTTSIFGTLVVERGIFYICDILQTNATHQTSSCASILNFDSSINSPHRWNYSESWFFVWLINWLFGLDLATSSASIAIGCAGLSVIILWLSGIYFNVRNKNKCTSCFLISISILLILTCKTIEKKKNSSSSCCFSFDIGCCLDFINQWNFSAWPFSRSIDIRLANVVGCWCIGWIFPRIYLYACFVL